MKIVPIGKPNLADIPAMLEHTAARMRAGEIEATGRVLVVMLCGEPGYRHIDVLDLGPGEPDAAMLGALGMLTAAQHRLIGSLNP